MRPFDEFADQLTKDLWGQVSIPFWDIIHDPTFIEAKQSILDTPKKRGMKGDHVRTDQEVTEDLILGKAVELGVHRLLEGSKIWDAPWEKSDPHSYGKDVVTKDGVRIEVKHTSAERCLWITGAKHHVLTRCIDHDTMDAIVVALATYNVASDTWCVKPHLVVEPLSYKYLAKNNGGYYSYPATHLAYQKGKCRYVNYVEEE